MTLRYVCNCGAKLTAKPDMAGKRVKCPSCAEPFTVPRPAEPISVSCDCGKRFSARTDLAGKRVKCPSCGDPLAIPASTDETPVVLRNTEDPLGLGKMSSNFADLSTPAPLPADMLPGTVQTASGNSAASPGAGRKSRPANPELLIVVAGWVAFLFGGIIALMRAYFMARVAFAALSSGSLQVIVSTSSALDLTYIWLSIWLAKSGLEIIGNESREEALRAAAQASLAFVVLGILGLLFIGLVTVLANVLPFGLGALVGALSLVATVMLVVYIVPPAFVLYVERLVATEECGFRNPVVLGATIVLPLIFLAFASSLSSIVFGSQSASLIPSDTDSSQRESADNEKSSLESLTAAVDRDSNNPLARKARGDWHAHRGNWKEAAEDLTVYSAATDDEDYVFRVPVLLLKTGDLDGYHAKCSELLKRFEKTRKPELAERTMKSCLAIAPQKGNLPRILALSERVVKMNQPSWLLPYTDCAQALCAYRHGDNRAAINWVDRCLDRPGSSSVAYRTAQCHFIRAMALRRLNERVKAKRDLSAAVTILDRHKALVKKSGHGSDWKDWLILEGLRSEAEAVVQNRSN